MPAGTFRTRTARAFTAAKAGQYVIYRKTLREWNCMIRWPLSRNVDVVGPWPTPSAQAGGGRARPGGDRRAAAHGPLADRGRYQ